LWRVETHALPLASVEAFQGREPALVIHLAVPGDPVAEIQVATRVALGPLQLLQDRQRAQAARRRFRIVEGVHGRQRVIGNVGDRNGQQPMRRTLAQFQEAALRPRADQELVELGSAMAVHAAMRMARGQITLVEREMLLAAFGRQDACIDIGIAREAAALAAIGDERIDRNAHRDAGVASLAVRPIDDVAGTAEAPAQRQRIQLRQPRIARVQHQVARFAVGPVAAGMLAGVEQAHLIAAHVATVVVLWIAAHAASISQLPIGDG
jgi:hypothetical protein